MLRQLRFLEGYSMSKLVEIIPNFSVSEQTDPAAFAALRQTAQTAPGCTLLNIHSDGDHNRCVFTLVGSPEGIEELAFRLCQKAAEVIDLRSHVGRHPRMGATDVLPFVPIRDMTAEDCVLISKRVAKRVWDELSIPSFLYEDSAENPAHRNLADCRRGEFEGMNEKLLLPDWAPDFGERRVHPTAGITAIGARMPLIAFNVNLDTDDLQLAKDIAKKIRGSSGGFPYCKALGIALAARNVAQVSMNLVNYEKTPIFEVYEAIRNLAAEQGVGILGSELVGMTPAKALLDCAESYLKLENFSCKAQVLECNLPE